LGAKSESDLSSKLEKFIWSLLASEDCSVGDIFLIFVMRFLGVKLFGSD
jgi:hypothetical protein